MANGIKTIQHRMVLGDNPLRLNLKVQMGAKVIIEKKADSFTGQFGRILHALMGGTRWEGYDHITNQRVIDYFAETPVRLRNTVDTSPYATINDDDLIVLASTPELHGLSGLYMVERVPNSELQLYEAVPPVAGAWNYTRGAAVAPPAEHPANILGMSGNVRVSALRIVGGFSNVATAYLFPSIILGSGSIQTDDSYTSPAVGFKDPWVYGYFGTGTGFNQLESTATVVGTPSVTTTASKIIISRTFSNNSGVDIPIRDIGLFSRATVNTSHEVLIARDPVAFTFVNGSSIVVSYEIDVNCAGTGGIMAQFNELLYRHLANTTREVKDIENQNQVHNPGFRTYYGAGPGGDNNPWYPVGDASQLLGEHIGPVVGTGTEAVSNTNFYLNTKVLHGEDDGALWHYGTVVSHFRMDEANNKVTWDVERIFENRGSTNIVVRESGQTGGEQLTTSVEGPESMCLLARHDLSAAPTTVLPGEFLKVKYTWEVPS